MTVVLNLGAVSYCAHVSSSCRLFIQTLFESISDRQPLFTLLLMVSQRCCITVLYAISFRKLKINLAALQCSLSTEFNKSELVHNPYNTRPYFTEGRITCNRNGMYLSSVSDDLQHFLELE